MVAKFQTSDKKWEVTSFPLVFDEWNIIDLSWTGDQGLSIYVNDTLQQMVNQATSYRPVITGTNELYVGRAQNHANRQYYNGEIDEIHFWKSTRQELVKKGIIAQPRCKFEMSIFMLFFVHYLNFNTLWLDLDIDHRFDLLFVTANFTMV